MELLLDMLTRWGRAKQTIDGVTTVSLLLLTFDGRADEYPTNLVGWQSYVESRVPSVNAEADLGALLHYNTNENVCSDLDKQICESLHIRSKSPMLISYREASFVFHYRTTNECFESSQQVGGSLNLIFQDGKIARTNSADQVPANYIRIVDPKVKYVTAEIDLLLSVAPLENPQDVNYYRRSFRFVHRNNWIKD